MSRHRDITERLRIGSRLRELREELKMTQQQVADATGVPRSNISQIESGKHSISIDLLAKIAKAVGASVEIVKS